MTASPKAGAPGLLAAAGIGACGAVAHVVVADHYLMIGWVIETPVPVLWLAVDRVALIAGAPLTLVVLGQRANRLTRLPWRTLIFRWSAPALATYALWLAATLALIRWLDPGFALITARDVREVLAVMVLPPAELAPLAALALLPALSTVRGRAAAGFAVVLLTATLLVPAIAYLVFVFAGQRMGGVLERLAAPPRAAELGSRAAVAFLGACVPAVDRIPEGLATVVAGLAALPLLLGAAAAIPARGPAVVGAAALPILALTIPGLTLADRVLLGRLSQGSAAVQTAAAVAEPLLLTALVVAGGMVPLLLGRRMWSRAIAVIAR